MPSSGFEPEILTIKRPQTYVLGRTATGITPPLPTAIPKGNHHGTR